MSIESQSLSHSADSLNKGRNKGGQGQEHLDGGHPAGQGRIKAKLPGSHLMFCPPCHPTAAAGFLRLGNPLSSELSEKGFYMEL